MTRTIYRERIPHTDPRLRRHVLHDSASRRYPFDTSRLAIASVEHERVLPVFDQGHVGKCTAEAALGVLGTAPYWSANIMDRFAKAFGIVGDKGTDAFYGAEETLDGDGPFPAQDNGSSGLTSAKVARAAGLISGWTQTFTLDEFLKALTAYPISCGTVWYESMSKVKATGMVNVDPTSGVAGGHQYECVGYSTATGLLKFANSWGTSWGDNGFFYMRASTFGKLLAHKGDATIFTPNTLPAPIPTPIVPVPTVADRALDAGLGNWPDAYHLGASNARVAHLLQTWRTDSGL